MFRAHRIDDKNENAASIKRAKFMIGKVAPDDAEDDASELPKFLNNHPNLEQSRALNSVSNCYRRARSETIYRTCSLGLYTRSDYNGPFGILIQKEFLQCGAANRYG